MSERRQFMRKKLGALGYVQRSLRKSEFRILDVSIDGLRVYFNGDPLLEAGMVVHIHVPCLNLKGFATLIRIESNGKGRYEAGFHFDAAAMHAAEPALVKEVDYHFH